MNLRVWIRVLLIVLSLSAAVFVVPALAQSPTTTSQGSTMCASETASPTSSRPTTPTTSSGGVLPPLTSSSSPTTSTSAAPTTTTPGVTDCPSPTTRGNNTTAAAEGEGSPGLALPIVVAGILAGFVMLGRREE